MKKTDTERNIERLKDAHGVSLAKHPVQVLVKQWLCDVVNPYHVGIHSPEGQAQREQNSKLIPAIVVDMMGTIMTIEELTAMMREVNDETDVSLKAIGTAYNRIKATSEVLIPELHKITADIRTSRMTTETEMRDTLKWLTTVREFFLENKYELEMKRLREFIDICKEIQALKDAGTLDAVAELAITLAIQEKKNGQVIT